MLACVYVLRFIFCLGKYGVLWEYVWISKRIGWIKMFESALFKPISIKRGVFRVFAGTKLDIFCHILTCFGDVLI